jgi:hypothetical protein
MQSLSSFFSDRGRGISLPVKIATHSIARLSSRLAALRLVAWNGHAASHPQGAGRGCKAAHAATATLLRLASQLDRRALERVQPGFQG